MQKNSVLTPTKKKRRPSMTQEQWAQHVTAWKTSDLSKTEYCKQHDIHSTILTRWAGVMSVSRDKKFKAVRVVAPDADRQTVSTAGIEIMVGQSIRIRMTVSEASLVVGIIRGLHATDH